MKLKSILLAAMLAASTGMAFANNVNATVPLVNLPAGSLHWTAGITASHEVGNFTDVFTFTPNAAMGSTANGWVLNSGFTTNDLISFTSATLTSASGPAPYIVYNGIGLPNGQILSGANLILPVGVSGPLTLTVIGTSMGGTYSGALNLTSPVPEPATYGMMLAGLAAVGFMARRRNQS